MTTKSKNYTWADLKEFCNNLNEKQLLFSVEWWGDERGGKVSCASPLDEDYYEDDYCLNPRSSFEGTDEEFDAEYEIDREKGYPVLWVD